MIKKIFIQMASVVLLLTSAVEAEATFSKEATQEPTLVQEGTKKPWCPICGMSLKQFYKTSHTHGKKQFCSVRCLIVDANENNQTLDNIQVVDAKTEQLIWQKKHFMS